MDKAEQRNKKLMVALAIATSFMIFITTEQCFENADIRNAITMAQTLRAGPGAPTLPEALVDAHPQATFATINWSGEVTDSHYGFVRVRAAVPAPGEVIPYVFDVNLTGNRLHPGNDRAKALMARLKPATPPPVRESPK